MAIVPDVKTELATPTPEVVTPVKVKKVKETPKAEGMKILEAYASFMSDPNDGAKFVKECVAIYTKLGCTEIADLRPKSKNAWVIMSRSGFVVCRAHTLKTKFEIKEISKALASAIAKEKSVKSKAP